MVTIFSKPRQVAISTAIVTALLLEGVFCIPFYAYPIGLKQDRATGRLTDERILIKEERFWKVCIPKFPEKGKKASIAEWLRNSNIMLLEPNMNCAPHYTQDITLVQNDNRVPLNAETAILLKKYIFDPTNVEQSQSRIGQPQYALNYHTYNLATNEKEAAWYSKDDMGMLQLVGSLSRDVRERFSPVKLLFEGMEDEERALNFNTDLQLGKAALLSDRAKGGEQRSALVDWYLDNNESPNFDLVACGITDKKKMLFVFPKNEVLKDNKCFRVTLTTSKNQLEHLIELWNLRQEAWVKHKIAIDAKPRYLSNYVLEETGAHLKPLIYRRGNAAKTPVVSVTVQPVAQRMETGANGRRKVVDMDEDLPANLVANILQSNEIPDSEEETIDMIKSPQNQNDDNDSMRPSFSPSGSEDESNQRQHVSFSDLEGFRGHESADDRSLVDDFDRVMGGVRQKLKKMAQADEESDESIDEKPRRRPARLESDEVRQEMNDLTKAFGRQWGGKQQQQQQDTQTRTTTDKSGFKRKHRGDFEEGPFEDEPFGKKGVWKGSDDIHDTIQPNRGNQRAPPARDFLEDQAPNWWTKWHGKK